MKTLIRGGLTLGALGVLALAALNPSALGTFGSGEEPARPHKPPVLQTSYHTRHIIAFDSTWTLPSTPSQITYWQGNVPTVVTRLQLERGLAGAARHGTPRWHVEVTYNPGMTYAMQVTSDDGATKSYGCEMSIDYQKVDEEYKSGKGIAHCWVNAA